MAFKMVMDCLGYNMLKNFAGYISKGDRSIAKRSVSLIHFENGTLYAFNPSEGGVPEFIYFCNINSIVDKDFWTHGSEGSRVLIGGCGGSDGSFGAVL